MPFPLILQVSSSLSPLRASCVSVTSSCLLLDRLASVHVLSMHFLPYVSPSSPPSLSVYLSPSIFLTFDTFYLPFDVFHLFVASTIAFILDATKTWHL
jgi:hypothetical protein